VQYSNQSWSDALLEIEKKILLHIIVRNKHSHDWQQNKSELPDKCQMPEPLSYEPKLLNDPGVVQQDNAVTSLLKLQDLPITLH